MKDSRPHTHVYIRKGAEYWVVGGNGPGPRVGVRKIQWECLVEVRNYREGKLYFWHKVRPYSWSNKKGQKRPRRMLCATRDLWCVTPITPTEMLARVPLEGP